MRPIKASVVPCKTIKRYYKTLLNQAMKKLQKRVAKVTPRKIHADQTIVFYKLPIVAVLELVYDADAQHRGWRVLTSGEGENPLFTFERIPPPPRGRNKQVHINPWFMREMFFAIRTVEEARVFLERFGPYQLDPDQKPIPITFRSLLSQQNFFMDAANLSLDEWRRLTKESYKDHQQATRALRPFFEDLQLWSDVQMRLIFEPNLQAQAISRSVSEALQASIFLDKAQRRIFTLCQCGCRQPIRATGGGGRKYFSKRCGNKVRQAKWRDAHPRN